MDMEDGTYTQVAHNAGESDARVDTPEVSIETISPVMKALAIFRALWAHDPSLHYRDEDAA